MRDQHIAYICITDKDGKVQLYSLYGDRNVGSTFEQLSKEEIQSLMHNNILWH